MLEKLGFDVKLKTISGDNYFQLISNPSTAELDTGWARLVRGLPAPERLLPATARRRKHPPTTTRTSPTWTIPELNAKIAKLSEEQLGSEQEAEYAELDRNSWNWRRGPPTAPTPSRPSSPAMIDLDEVVFNPTFGQDLASFQLK